MLTYKTPVRITSGFYKGSRGVLVAEPNKNYICTVRLDDSHLADVSYEYVEVEPTAIQPIDS